MPDIKAYLEGFDNVYIIYLYILFEKQAKAPQEFNKSSKPVLVK